MCAALRATTTTAWLVYPVKVLHETQWHEENVRASHDEPEDVVSRGEAIYRERIERQVEPIEKGSFVVIDVESGDYEIDERDATATRRLLHRRPSAVTYGVRVGHRAAYSHVGGFRTTAPDE